MRIFSIYRKRKLVLSKAVLSFIAIEILFWWSKFSSDVHRAVFASARPNQRLESWEARKAPSKIKILPKTQKVVNKSKVRI